MIIERIRCNYIIYYIIRRESSHIGTHSETVPIYHTRIVVGGGMVGGGVVGEGMVGGGVVGGGMVGGGVVGGGMVGGGVMRGGMV